MNRAAASRALADGSAALGRRRPPQKATAVILVPGLAIDTAFRRLMGVSYARFRANLTGVLQSTEPEYVRPLRLRHAGCAVLHSCFRAVRRTAVRGLGQ